MKMKSKRFFDSFPPPTFLTMPAVGISVEADALRLAYFERSHNALVLKKHDTVAFERGAVTAGDITSPEKITEALTILKQKHGVHFARFALPEEKAYAYDTIIPVSETGDIADAVEFSIDQNIPLTAGEAVFDYAVLGDSFLNNDVRSVRVVVSAYPRALVDTWFELFAAAGITLVQAVSESQAVAHAVVAHGDKRPRILVHFLKDKTIIAITADGFIRFSTTVSGGVGGAIDDTHTQKVLDSHAGERISESVELLAVRDEVKKVFAYWKSKENIRSRTEPRNIQELVVSGYVGDMADVADYLGTHVGVSAHQANVWQNAFSLNDVVPDIHFEDSLPLAVVVGASLSE